MKGLLRNLKPSLQAHGLGLCAQGESFGGPLVLLWLAVLVFCVGCGKQPAESPVETSSVQQEEVESPYCTARCYSTVDGRELTARIFLPEDYDFAPQRPLIVVTSEMQFPETPALGQALIAKLDPVRSTDCPDTLYLEDCGNLIDFIVHNFAVDSANVFLAGATRQDLLLACRKTPLFAGAFLALEGSRAFDFDEMPLRNLRNIPVYLENVAANGNAKELEKRLAHMGNPKLNAPKNILGTGRDDARLAAAFDWLAGMASPKHEKILWDCDSASCEGAWWLRVVRLWKPGRPCGVTAQCLVNGRGWSELQITTRNCRSFAIQTNAVEFHQSHPLLLKIDGSSVGVRAGQGWITLECEKTGAWRQCVAQDAASESVPAGLGKLFLKPPLFVVGTGESLARSELWRSAAKDAARAWQNTTGIVPLVRMDDEIADKDLEGRSLLLFGSPAENQFAETLLEGDPLFLKRLFHLLPENQRADAGLTAITLCHAEILSQETIAVLVLANGDEAITTAWKPLLEKSTEAKDYLFRSPTLRRSGCFNPDWSLP